MKIVVLGDIHGRDCWEKVWKDNQDVDKFIFLGDYFDSRDISPLIQLDNFYKIKDLQEKYPDKVILLTGNHDEQYLNPHNGTFSGYQTMFHMDINEALRKANLKYCHVEGNIVFTHAGISIDWAEKFGIDLNGDIENQLNTLHSSSYKFDSGPILDYYGYYRGQGPLWIRPATLRKKGVLPENIIQVVGHTRHIPAERVEKNLVLIDSLCDNYLLIKDNEFIIKNVYNGIR